MAQIDSLDIQINASLQGADEAFDRLIKSLENLEKAFGKISSKKFTSQLDKISKTLEQTDARLKKFTDGANNAGRSVSSMTASMKSAPGIMSSFAAAISKAGQSTFSLAKLFGTLNANFWWMRRLFQKGLGAIEIASDLTEVQNVVDVTFDNMAYKLDEFAKTSRQQFGLSELSLKTYASQFQAMFSAMGVTEEQVAGVHKRLGEETERAAYAQSKGYKMVTKELSDMSLNLTKLAADMGSFFNQEPENVAKRLQAGVISGQSRALRQYGLDLTIATLQSWALAKGIHADVQEMTQAEKTMLRYQYVMEQMAMTQGDFARTSQTWANQIKLLKQNFQALGAVIGVALVGWIKPAIIAINNAMNTIIALVQKAVNAIGKLMGWQVEISQVGAGLANDGDDIGGALEDAADGAGDTAGGLGKANKAAKELKKTILGFDELNVLNGNTGKEDESGAGGGAGGGGASGFDIGGLARLGGASGGNLKRYESDINSWWELGRKISRALYDAMDSIDWDSIYEKARNFGKNLANFLNGLITPKLFGKVGETIAGALNTALEFLNTFGSTFNWKKFGLSLATGLNKFFRTFKFDTLAKSINAWAKGILDAIIKFIDKTDWSMIGTKIGELLLDIDFLAIGRKVGEAIWKAINAGFKVLEGMFEVAPLETAILGTVGSIKLIVDAFKLLKGLAIAKFFKDIIKPVKDLTLAIGKPLLTGISTFIQTISLGGNAFEAMGDSLRAIGSGLTTFQSLALGIGATALEFFAVKDAVSDLVLGTGEPLLNWLELLGSIGVAAAAIGIAFNPLAGIVAAVATAAVGSIVGMDEAVRQMRINDVMESLRTEGELTTDAIDDYYSHAINTITEGNADIIANLQSLSDQRQGIEELAGGIEGIGLAMEADADVIGIAAPKVIEQYRQLVGAINDYIDKSTESLINNILAQRSELEARGVDVGKMIADILKRKNDITTANNEWYQSLYAAGQALDGTREKEEAFMAVLDAIPAPVENAIKKNDEFTNSLSDMSEKGIQKIEDFKKSFDFSEYDGDAEALAYAIGESLDNAINVFDEKSAELNEVWRLQKEQLQADLREGILSPEEYAQMYQVGEDGVRKAQENIENAISNVTSYYERILAEKMGDIAKNADSNWYDSTWVQKTFGLSHGDEILARMDIFADDVLLGENGLQGKINKAYERFAPGTEPAINKAVDEMYSLFDTRMQEDAEGFATGVEETFFVNGEAGFSSAIDRIVQGVNNDTKFKDVGEKNGQDFLDGLKSRLDKNMLSVKPSIKNIWTMVDTYWRSPELADSHSPSRKTAEWGKDIVDGFTKGIEQNESLSVTTVGNWWTSLKDKITTNLSDLMTTMQTDTDSGLTTTADTFSTKLDEMKNTASEIYENIKDATSSAFGDVKDAISESISGAKDVVDDGVRGMESIFSGMHFEFPDIKLPHFSWSTFDIGWGISLPSISIDWYAKGGFPEDGLFMANHGELVGQFSNGKTAVANNEQIIEGIQGGVTRAIVQYLPEIIRDAVSAADTGGGDIYIGDEQIARAANRGNRKIDRRYNPVMQY